MIPYEEVVAFYRNARMGKVLRVEQEDCDGVTEIRFYRLPRLYQEYDRFLNYLHDHSEGRIFTTFVLPAEDEGMMVEEMPEFMTQCGG